MTLREVLTERLPAEIACTMITGNRPCRCLTAIQQEITGAINTRRRVLSSLNRTLSSWKSQLV